MGFAPFTIFFMACLMGFFGNSARAHDCSVSVEWPEKCANKTYCQVKPGKGYPTTSEFKTMKEYSNFDFSKVKTPPPTDRQGDGFCSRQTHEIGFIYMIKDTKNRTRYVVQDPEVFQIQSEFRECKQQVQPLPPLTCQQNFTPLDLPVTTCDGKGIELIKFSIPTSCGARIVFDYND